MQRVWREPARAVESGYGISACDRCGTGAWTIVDVLTDSSATFSSEVLGTLTPGGDTARDWKQRWRSIQADLESLCRPSVETMSRDTIFAWRDRLCGWHVQAYHLKDALKGAASTLGIGPQAIDTAINNDLRLALLADLANQEKHSQLNRPRSGYAPRIGVPKGTDIPPRGWILKIDVNHGSQTLDGLQIARDAAIAWREHLEAWRLIERASRL